MATDKKLELNLLAQLTSHMQSIGYAKACATILVDDDFCDSECQATWRMVKVLAERGTQPNHLNLYTHAKELGKPWNMQRFISVQGNGDIIMMASVLHEIGNKRRLQGKLSELLIDLDNDEYHSSEAVKELETAVADINKDSSRSVVPFAETYTALFKTIERKANGEIAKGIMTGYWLIDKEGGFEDGALIVVAGRTSNGKTAFALNLATNIARGGVPVVVYSLEMTNEQVTTRITANLSGVSAGAIKQAQLNDEQWSSVASVNTGMPLYFDDNRASGKDEIFSAIRNVVDSKGARVVFIDYLQLMRGAGKDKRQDIGNIANELKVIAVELHITIVLLSQLAREGKGATPVPRISELKESGEIENACDAVYMVYRPEQHSPTLAYPDMTSDWSRYSTKGTALLICAKNRNGMMGEQLLAFDRDTMRFYERGQYELASHSSDLNFHIP